MGRLRGVIFVLGGGIATIIVAVGWVSLRWLDRDSSPRRPANVKTWGTIAAMPLEVRTSEDAWAVRGAVGDMVATRA